MLIDICIILNYIKIINLQVDVNARIRCILTREWIILIILSTIYLWQLLGVIYIIRILRLRFVYLSWIC